MKDAPATSPATSISEKLEMSDGAVAMLDALGVKGAWRKNGGETTAVVGTLKTARAIAAGMQNYAQTALIPRLMQGGHLKFQPVLSVLAFSDTIIIAAQAPAGTTLQASDRSILLDLVCQYAAYVMRFAAKSSPPLVYRGVITVGRILIEGTILLGPAVDEAAGLYEQAEGAFVWFAPSAFSVPKPTYGHPDVWTTMVFRHAVPIKGGQSIETRALSPFIDSTHTAPERAEIRAGYEQAMTGDRVDIVIKRQNTMAFIARVVHLDAEDGK